MVSGPLDPSFDVFTRPIEASLRVDHYHFSNFLLFFGNLLQNFLQFSADGPSAREALVLAPILRSSQNVQEESQRLQVFVNCCMITSDSFSIGFSFVSLNDHICATNYFFIGGLISLIMLIMAICFVDTLPLFILTLLGVSILLRYT